MLKQLLMWMILCNHLPGWWSLFITCYLGNRWKKYLHGNTSLTWAMQFVNAAWKWISHNCKTTITEKGGGHQKTTYHFFKMETVLITTQSEFHANPQSKKRFIKICQKHYIVEKNMNGVCAEYAVSWHCHRWPSKKILI